MLHHFMNGFSYSSLIKVTAPLVSIFIYFTLFMLTQRIKKVHPYILFFSISITSLLGFTKTLTGFHTESSHSYLYGLSFYTVSVAFYLYSHPPITFIDAFKFSNPLLLITGPIAIFIKNIWHIRWYKRVNYYLPFCLVGLFFYQVIAVPLTPFFCLIEKTDCLSSLFFAIIFEIFVYTNFCGLSLIMYGFFGILGFKIPLNFKQPFSSTNIIDFWKGWHTSLSFVLKAFFYTPLRSHFPPFVALFSVYMASAVWHGITFNFLLWGSFHASLFFISLYFLKRQHRFIPFILFISGVVIGRMIFADSNIFRLFKKFSFSFNNSHQAIHMISSASHTSQESLIIGLLLILIECVFQKNKTVKKRNYKYLRSPIALLILVLIGIFFVSTGEREVHYAVYGQR